MNYYHRERPSFSRYQHTCLWDEVEINLYLDTGKKEQVLGLYYELHGRKLTEEEEQWLAGDFSELAKKIESQPFMNIPTVVANGRFPLAWTIYRRFVCEIQESFISWPHQKGRDGNELLCRCFGVYKEDIHELVGSGVELTSLRDLGDHLQAGIGCGSCHDDLREVLNPLLSAPIKMTTENEDITTQALWEKLDAQSLASESHDIIRRFCGKNSQFGELKLAGTRPGSVLVSYPRILDEVLKKELKSLLEEQFSNHLGKGLKLVFLAN